MPNQRFANIEARLDEIQKPKASTAAAYAQAPASAMEATLPTEEDYDDDGDEESTRRLAALEKRLRTLETSGQTAKLHPSKNVRAADSAETQQSANPSRRRKKMRAEAATSEATR